jgi:hypothetical protein
MLLYNFLEGCLILCDGQVVWNDFLDCDILPLYEYIRLKETMKLREMAIHLSRLNGLPEAKLFRSQSALDMPDEVQNFTSS